MVRFSTTTWGKNFVLTQPSGKERYSLAYQQLEIKWFFQTGDAFSDAEQGWITVANAQGQTNLVSKFVTTQAQATIVGVSDGIVYGKSTVNKSQPLNIE